MKKLGLLLMLLSGLAQAGEATLTWTAPTQRTDGTAYTNPDGYRIFYWVDSQPEMVYDVTDPAVLTHTFTNLAGGLWSFQMTAYDTDALESARTNVVTKLISEAPPEPPGVMVTRTADVYTVQKRVDRFLLLRVGSVPLGVECVSDQTVNGMYVVPRSAVTWAGNIQPDVVVGVCQ